MSDENNHTIQVYDKLLIYFNNILDDTIKIILKNKRHVIIKRNGLELSLWDGSQFNPNMATIRKVHVSKDKENEINGIINLCNSRRITLRYFLELLYDKFDLNFHVRLLESTHMEFFHKMSIDLSGFVKDGYAPLLFQDSEDCKEISILKRDDYGRYNAVFIGNKKGLTNTILENPDITELSGKMMRTLMRNVNYMDINILTFFNDLKLIGYKPLVGY